MLFTYDSLDADEKRVEEATARIRDELRFNLVPEPPRWTGLLARMTRAGPSGFKQCRRDQRFRSGCNCRNRQGGPIEYGP